MINLRIKSYFSYFKKVWRRDTWIYSAKWKSAWVTSISYCNVLQAEKCMCVLRKSCVFWKIHVQKSFYLKGNYIHSGCFDTILRLLWYNNPFSQVRRFHHPLKLKIQNSFLSKLVANSKVFLKNQKHIILGIENFVQPHSALVKFTRHSISQFCWE